MLPLTKRQKQILDYIHDYIDKNDYAPTFREIGEHFKLSSVATVAEHIESLKNRGYLQKEPTLARSIQLTATEKDQITEVPLLGTIAAGEPIEAIRTSETIDLPRDMIGPNIFALKVKGDSMVEDGILDGDYVIIEKTETPQNGDIVVALLEGENVTLKKFYREKSFIRLSPANRRYRPLKVRRLVIQGRVRGIIRKFR